MEKYLNKVDKILELLSDDKALVAKIQLEDMRKELIYDLALKNSKNKYEKEQLKSAKALLKSASDDRPLFKKMYQVDGTYQLCNGFIAIVLYNMIAGLELNTKEIPSLDCRTVVKPSSGNYVEYDYNYKEVDIDLLELEQLAVKIKKNKESPYPIELLGHKFNTYYHPLNLLTAIKILGTQNVKVYFHTTNAKDPIYLKSDLGEGIVLPMKMPDEKK